MHVYIYACTTKITKTWCWHFLNTEVGLIMNNLFHLIILVLKIVRPKLGAKTVIFFLNWEDEFLKQKLKSNSNRIEFL